MANIMFTPLPGATGHIHSIICGAPRGNPNQTQNVSYYGDALLQPNCSGYGAILATRYYHGELVNSIGQ